MKKLILITALIVMAVHTNSLNGQIRDDKVDSKYPMEELAVHLTQKNVFPGEIIWFKIYCTSPLYPKVELSKMAYIELISSDNASLLREKIVLNKGEGDGDFIIPENIQSGVYYIMAYTNWMKNFGEESFFKTRITVINPEEKFNYLENEINGTDGETVYTNEIGSKETAAKLKVTPQKQEYSTREKVSLKIGLGKSAGLLSGTKFSVSVSRKEPLMYVGGDFDKSKETYLQPESILTLPDYKGVRLSGNITDASGVAIAGEEVILSHPGQGTDVNSTKTDNNGNFHFLLKSNQGQKDVVFTLPSPNLKLKLEESFWNGFSVMPSKGELSLSNDAVLFLKEKYSHFQLQKKYKQHNFLKNNIQSDFSSNGDWLFYGKPQQLIKMSEYITLDSITEYFWELIPSVKFVQRRGKFDISVIDPVTFFPFNDAPGVFVDGVLYSDFDAIAKIPVEDVKQIAVTTETYYYRDFTFGGIVDIHTKKGDLNSVKILSDMARMMYPLGDLQETSYVPLNYAGKAWESRLPDLRYLIHWEPNVTVDDKGEAAVEFYTGDIEGEFVVEVVGVSNDGEILQSKNKIIVGVGN